MLHFETVYCVTLPSAVGIALGVRPIMGVPTEGASPEEGIGFLWAGERGLLLYGQVVEDRPDGSVLFQALRGAVQGSVLFEPLTIERWREMKAASAPEIAQQLTSTEAVQEYYKDAFLYPYWRERYETYLREGHR